MSEEQSPRKPAFYALAAAAVEDAVDRIRRLKEEGTYISKHYPWPQISYWANGMPYFLPLWISSCPEDYSEVFRKGTSQQVNTDELPTFQALFNYTPPQDTLPNHLKSEDGTLSPFYNYQLPISILSLIDRYLHIHGDAPFSAQNFLPLYLPVEAGLFDDKLSVDVLVPIILLNFALDFVELGLNTAIIKLSEDFQLARALIGELDRSGHSRVSAAATHALVLAGYELANNNWIEVSTVLSRVTAFPLQDIDAFFTAVRIVTGYSTGYAQLLFVNSGWTHKYTAHLPSLAGDSTRRYPAEFENDVQRSVPTVTSEQATAIGQTFEKLRASISNNQIRIASRRLNLCYLRETDEDAILDATIGLESLLVSGERTEITHKLGLRMAALTSLTSYSESEPAKVFRDIKDIYAFRSGVAHGGGAPIKKREIAINTGQTIPTVKVAIDYLRLALAVLLEHPVYLQTSRIDEELLLAKLKPPPSDATPPLPGE